MELRRRVKEQFKRMGGIEYSKVNLSFIDKRTGQETFVTCKELGSTQIIPEGPLAPGDCSPLDSTRENRYSLYRIQINCAPGGIGSTSWERPARASRKVPVWLSIT